jgi:hypothetical protein
MMMAAMILMMSERDGRWSMPRRSCRVRVFGGVCGLRSAARLGCAGVRLQCAGVRLQCGEGRMSWKRSLSAADGRAHPRRLI